MDARETLNDGSMRTATPRSVRVTLRVARHPVRDGRKFSEFRLNLDDQMTVLDALVQAQRDCDGTLAFRCACRVGMCGTCAATVNRIPRLVCSTRVKNLDSEVVTVEPLPQYPVIRDVAVSLAPFFAVWRRARPAFRPKNPGATTLAVVNAHSRFRTLTAGKRDCITCGACYAACSITAMNPAYLGPAAVNRAWLRLLDPRETASAERRQILDRSADGVWRCHTQFNCTAVCPRHIDLADTIGRVKRSLLRSERFHDS